MASLTTPLLLAFVLLSSLAFPTQSQVPPSEQFRYVNQGDLGEYIVEYDANYRFLDPFAFPFQLCFYNTSPDAFTLALRMGTTSSESVMRWVWEANRGNPVRENATLTLGEDGNLVLAEADGRVVWQTDTAGKGVVGFRLLGNGNMVLYDSTGKFVWQSFDHPTDTLLVGQALRVGGPTRLVSRTSEKNNADGAYSFVLERTTVSLYYTSSNSHKSVRYWSDQFLDEPKGLDSVVLIAEPDEGTSTMLGLRMANHGTRTWARPKYNATLTFLRIGYDGNLRMYTYYPEVTYRAWEVTFAVFTEDEDMESLCQLPDRCGDLGLCWKSQCVACPVEQGLLGWSEDCKPKKLTSCKPEDFHYYELQGVDHFAVKYTRGTSSKEEECGNKCTGDCKCLGYFYNRDSSRCWLAYDLKTLTKVQNSSHVAYIKTPNARRAATLASV